MHDSVHACTRTEAQSDVATTATDAQVYVHLAGQSQCASRSESTSLIETWKYLPTPPSLSLYPNINSAFKSHRCPVPVYAVTGNGYRTGIWDASTLIDSRNPPFLKEVVVSEDYRNVPWFTGLPLVSAQSQLSGCEDHRSFQVHNLPSSLFRYVNQLVTSRGVALNSRVTFSALLTEIDFRPGAHAFFTMVMIFFHFLFFFAPGVAGSVRLP